MIFVLEERLLSKFNWDNMFMILVTWIWIVLQVWGITSFSQQEVKPKSHSLLYVTMSNFNE